jgi:hypothetical protein
MGRGLAACLVLTLMSAASLVLAGGLSDVVGTVMALDVERREIVVREKLQSGDGKDIRLLVDPKATVRVEQRRSAKLEEIHVGDTVAVASLRKGGWVATSTSAKQQAPRLPGRPRLSAASRGRRSPRSESGE